VHRDLGVLQEHSGVEGLTSAFRFVSAMYAWLAAATGTAAQALGLGEHVGTVEEGKLADLLIVDGDPLAEPELLADSRRIWLVLQLGVPVAGQAMEQEII